MLLEYCWSQGPEIPTACSVGMGVILLETVLPCLIFGALALIIIEALQVGFRFNPALLAPRVSTFSPASGLLKLGKGLRDSWQPALRLSVFTLVFSWVFSDIVREVVCFFFAGPQEQAAAARESVVRVIRTGLGVCGICGLADYWLRRRAFFREQSMSLEELKREHREDEGDPHVRAARKALHRSLTIGEIASRTRRAKVVVVKKN